MHAQTMAGPSPHNTKSLCPAKKAWRHLIRHGAPLQLQVFLVFYNGFSSFNVVVLSESWLLHGVFSLRITFTERFDLQGLPSLIPQGVRSTKVLDRMIKQRDMYIYPIVPLMLNNPRVEDKHSYHHHANHDTNDQH
jgi:hypothetical protein